MMKTVEKSTSKPCNNPFLGFVAFAKSTDRKVNNALSISCYPSSTSGYPTTPTTLKRTLLTQAQIKTLIKHRVDVSIAMSITPVREISSIKYVKVSDIPLNVLRN